MRIRLCAASVLLVLTSSFAYAGLLDINDGTTFIDLVDELKSKAFASGSGLYVTPSPAELTNFHNLAAALWTAQTDGELQTLVNPADNLGYDVVKLQDNGVTYFGLREQLQGGNQTLGWGSFFVRQGNSRYAMVQSPHPLFDTNTPQIASTAFVQSQARGFVMAGAHRNANGSGTADVAHLTDSIFLEVHKAWNGFTGENIAWQVHGFNLDNYPTYPVITDAVLSNGTGAVSPEIIALDAQIQALGVDWTSFSYNTLDPNDPTNLLVNDGVDGETFGPPGGLGATSNQQQLYSTGLGGTFVHIELEQTFRLTGDANRQLAADAISLAIIQTTELTYVPEPTSAMLLVGAMLITAIRRRAAKRGS